MLSTRSCRVSFLGSVFFLAASLCAQVRQPSVAGQFYPASPSELRDMLGNFFAHAQTPNAIDGLRALIVPHAGYVYSGQVAANGFVRIDPQRDLANVFVIGVSHNAAYPGAAVYVSGDFLTPLGRVPVNTQIGHKLLERRDLFVEYNRAHEVEHSLEVQLPFLQYHMKTPFKLVPVLLGTADPDLCRRLADVLRPYFTRENLFVISTDLSHYPSCGDAVTVDHKTIDAVLSRSPQHLLSVVAGNEKSGVRGLVTSMCGLGGVLLLQEILRSTDQVEFTLLQYKNSGDVPVGEKERVVGYAAIAVVDHPRDSFSLLPTEKRELLRIARSTLEEYLKTRKIPDLHMERLQASLRSPCGAFVTLKKHGELRGCIGNFSATEELAKTVQNMAIAAATEDPRFEPVRSQELSSLDLEVSVLSPMRKISSEKEIQLGKHGIYIRKGNHAGTLLPQVAEETGWSLEEFLGHCARDKAGLGWDGWKDAELFVYEAIVFGESDHDPGR
jgi:MEMO1 family protein